MNNKPKEREKGQRQGEQGEKVLESSGYHLSSHDSHSHHLGSTRLEILLQQFNEASKRVRLSLITVCLASMLLIVGVFNHQWSWLATKEFRLHENWPAALKDPIDPIDYTNNSDAIIAALNRISENDQPEYPKHQIHELLEVELKTVEVPVLGIQIYAEDLPLLGGIGILLILTWFYFVRRRERGIVKMLHSMMVFAPAEKKKSMIARIYTTISFSQVFNTVSHLDEFNVKKKWNWSDRQMSHFASVMPWIPFYIICFVVVVDVLESFVLKGKNKKPDIEYISKNFRSFGLHDKDTIYSYEKSDVFKLAENYLKELKSLERLKVISVRDSLLKSEKSNVQLLIEYKSLVDAYHSRMEDIEKHLFVPTTTMAFLSYHSEKLKEFKYKHARFGLSLEWDLIIIRTAFPILILAGIFIIAGLARRTARSRDFHVKGLSLEYEKYYSINYNIYRVDYAYANFFVYSVSKGPIMGARIEARKNRRSKKSDHQGQARLIELQEIGTEEFVLTLPNGQSSTKSINLEAINRVTPAEINSNASKKEDLLYLAYDSEHGNPVDRFTASRQLVKGEHTCTITIHDDCVNPWIDWSEVVRL